MSGALEGVSPLQWHRLIAVLPSWPNASHAIRKITTTNGQTVAPAEPQTVTVDPHSTYYDFVKNAVEMEPANAYVDALQQEKQVRLSFLWEFAGDKGEGCMVRQLY